MSDKKDICYCRAEPYRRIFKGEPLFRANGVNITRVSYNNAVDSHMLFIDAEGTAPKLMVA